MALDDILQANDGLHFILDVPKDNLLRTTQLLLTATLHVPVTWTVPHPSPGSSKLQARLQLLVAVC